MKCDLCFHQCELTEGKTGFCKARGMRDGKIVSLNYGCMTSLALDPVEKKPLAQFQYVEYEKLTPEEVVNLALRLADEQGNIGIAYTYNEPLIGYEFIYDCAKLAHAHGLKNVLVTNGAITSKYLMDLLPYIDAMNIDLKAFTSGFYEKIGGNLELVKENIILCSAYTHVELTTLIIPGRNDGEEEMQQMTKWIASISKDIPLHISRYFPRYHCHIPPTDVDQIEHLCHIARMNLNYVYKGNC